MAWQLIYTSAPRLLEAGRSGFGSVARHRQISPLLVSAIERSSQFSRQPGMDPGRIIFSHRIVPISGGRFHVLSCIRDAGADYTGRTNHIAHHVIAEAREVSQLGSHGASPADVLLTMPWSERWDDSPRYLEAAEELHLADFSAQTAADGAHWASVTGNPAHAWLLAAGEASRGAYLIPPDGTDLRWLIADSLRLAPERLWQTSFTTSLQSKDEISDYRWIGLESDSPLRGDIASSGRPVIDLTRPDRLPVPEAVPTPAEISAPIAASAPESAVQPKLVISLKTAASPFANPPPSQETRSTPAIGPQTPTPPQFSPIALQHPRARSAKAVWISIAAAAVVLGVALQVVLPVLLERHRIEGVRDEIKSTLSQSEYFSPETNKAMVGAGNEPIEVVELLAELATRSFQSAAFLRSTGANSFQRMGSRRLSAIIAHRPSGMPNIPTEIQQLDDILNQAHRQFDAIEQVKLAYNRSDALAQLERKRQDFRDKLQKLDHKADLDRIAKILETKAFERQIQAIKILLASEKEPSPPEATKPENKIKWFRHEIEQLTGDKQISEVPNARPTLSQMKAILDNWEDIEGQKSGSVPYAAIDIGAHKDWPKWLQTKARDVARKAQESIARKPNDTVLEDGSKPHAPATIYLAVGNDALKSVNIKELREDMHFYLSKGDASKKSLYAPPGGKIRIDVQHSKPAFVVENNAIAASEDAPNPPYKLSGESQGSPGFELLVLAPESPARLPETPEASLARTGDVFRVTGKLPTFANVSSFILVSPKGFAGGGAVSSFPLSPALDVDLTTSISELRKTATEFRARSGDLRKVIQAASSAPSLDALKKKAKEYSRVFKEKGKGQAQLRAEAQKGPEIVGDYAVAITKEWEQLLTAKDYAALGDFGDQLAGNAITPAGLKNVNAGLAKAVAEMEKTYHNDKLSNALRYLRDLSVMLAPLLEDNKAVAEHIAKLKLDAEANDTSAEALEKLPLLAGDEVPSGDYNLEARTALDREVVIATITVKKP